jgi:hypothetical protein
MQQELLANTDKTLEFLNRQSEDVFQGIRQQFKAPHCLVLATQLEGPEAQTMLTGHNKGLVPSTVLVKPEKTQLQAVDLGTYPFDLDS